MTSTSLDSLFSDLLTSQQQSFATLPPVHLWKPELSGDIDIVVDREGRWIHEGGEIKRPALVKLFASILVREEGVYFLVTPVEKWRIRVDAAPLFVIAAEREIRDGYQTIKLTTRTDDAVVLGSNHPLWIESINASQEPLPFVMVRGNLPGLLSRNVFYQLVEWAADEAAEPVTGELFISSMGERFSLGQI
jgi:hypothetical protein